MCVQEDRKQLQAYSGGRTGISEADNYLLEVRWGQQA